MILVEGIQLINLDVLKDFSRVRKYESGTIFSSDGTGSEMFVIFNGEVAILNSLDDSVIETVGPGDFFDASLVFSDKRLHLTSIAVTEVIAFPISVHDIVSLMINEPKFVYEIMKAMNCRIENSVYNNERTMDHSMAKRKQITSDIVTEALGSHSASDAAGGTETVEARADEAPAPARISRSDFSLFPAGHTGDYHLNLMNDSPVMCEIEYKCPVCGSKFKGLKILSTKLVSAVTDNDMRKHYKNFEPVYYEVITCPHCLYSALENIFCKPEDISSDFVEELKELKKSAQFEFGVRPDTATVFAGYYLALICAPNCFQKAQLIQAKLLQKLSWLYHDCGDENMETNLARQALDEYMRSYQELDISASGEILLFISIAELYAKFGDFKEARNYYYKAKTNSQISPLLKKKAEDRLEELKELNQPSIKNEAEEVKTGNKKGFSFLRRRNTD